MGDIENKPDHDAEAWLIEQHHDGAINLDADVLVMGHHGSNNAGNRPLLETVDQDWTMISADSTYHPATETLRTLQVATDSGVCVTGSHGRTTFTGDLPPTPTNTDTPTEPWRIDQEKHASTWSEIVEQEQTEKEELKTDKESLKEQNKELEEKYEQLKEDKEHLAAQRDTSPTIMDRIRSTVPLLGKRNESAITSESTDGSPTKRSQPDQDTDATITGLAEETESEHDFESVIEANAAREPPDDTIITGLETEAEREHSFENIVGPRSTEQDTELASAAADGYDEEHDDRDNDVENNPNDGGYDIGR
jgi:FtsZ-binding cell division protein ZapB